ncbi:uncharacterized protein HGUI_02098 [Hanseniaspora guilliermondii]|uniref:Protein kinase domain-containing protein n=1 Tax=Hanseniaspora guilliermondii TaxID=56406 RepID=A0A1L0B0G7_9ASCO|nr:uncharacterized protein HGUI_02098 [Hanseniaspora guilliermondii]
MANPLIQNIAINRNANYHSNVHNFKDVNSKNQINEDFSHEQPEMRFGNQLYTNDSWGSNSSLESLNLILEKQRKQQLNNPLHQTHIFLPVKIKLEYDPITKKTMLNHYEIIKEMGQGQFGKVKLVKNMHTNELNAMKIVNKHSSNMAKKFSLEPDQNTMNETLDSKAIIGNQKNDGNAFNQNFVDHGVSDDKIRKEVTIMKLLNNKNVIKLIEVLNDPESKKIYLILEYCAHGEIKWCSGDQLEINAKGPSLLSFGKSKDYFRQVVLGLEYLQIKNVLHRDLKPANLLLTANDVVKISDFGCSLLLNDCSEEDLIKTVGTPVFYAPEICISNAVSFYKTKSIRQVISFSLDIWALGITLYCFLFGKLPFNSNHEMKLFEIICHGKLEFPINAPDIDVRQLLQAQNILLKLLDKNPQTRITIDEIKNHPFTLDGLSESQKIAFLNDKIQSLDYSDIEYDDFLPHDDYYTQRDHYDLDLSGNNKKNHSKVSNAGNRLVTLPLNSSFASLDSFYIDRNASMLAKNDAKNLVDSEAKENHDLGVSIDISNSVIPKSLRQFTAGKRLSLESTGIVQKAFENKFNKRADKKSLDLNRANPEHSVPRSHYLPQNSSVNSSTLNGKIESKHWKYYNDQSDSDSDDNGFDDPFEYTGYYKNDNYRNDMDYENFSETESLPFEFKEDSDHEEAVYDQMKTNMAHLENTEINNSSGVQYDSSKNNVYMVDALYTDGNSNINEHLNKVNETHPGHGKKKGNLILMDSSEDEEDEGFFYQDDIKKEYTLVDNVPSSSSKLSLHNVTEQDIIHNSSQSSSLSAVVDLQGIQQVDIPEDLLMQMNPCGVDLRKNYSEQSKMIDHSVAIDNTRKIHSVSDLKKIRSNNGSLNFRPTMSSVLMKKSGALNNQLFASRFNPLQTSRSADITKSFTTECTKTTANSVLHRTTVSAKAEDYQNEENLKQASEQTNNIKSVDILQSFIHDK